MRSDFSIRCTRRECCWRRSRGELAADAIVEGLEAGDMPEGQLGKWGTGFNRGDRMRRLVCEY